MSKKSYLKKGDTNNTYNYKVVIVNSLTNTVKKVLYKGTSSPTARLEYENTLKESKRVFYPKLVNKCGNEFTDFKREVLFLKEATKRSTRINMFDDKWKIIYRSEYFEEEKFIVYGFDWTNKKTLLEIVEIIKSQKTNNREIGVLNNKVIIHNEDFLDMVTTKTKSEGTRFAKVLYKTLNSKRRFFLRLNYKVHEKTQLFTMLEEETGYSRRFLRKTFS